MKVRSDWNYTSTPTTFTAWTQLYFIYACNFQVAYLKCHNQNPSPPHVQQALHISCHIYTVKFYFYILNNHGNDVLFSDTPI